jgi:hypothetical protein
MSASAVFLLLMIGGIIGTVVYLRGRRAKTDRLRLERAAPHVRGFFERTGYVFTDLPGAPPVAQWQRWEMAYKRYLGGGSYILHLARAFQGLHVQWKQETRMMYRQIAWIQSWSAPLPWPVTVVFHLSERSNLAPTSGNRSSSWQPSFPRMVQIGDPMLDQRFVLYAPPNVDDQRIRSIIGHPKLRQALLASAYVNLELMPDGVRYSDPGDHNATAALGGPQASSRFMIDLGEKLGGTISVHDRVADILLGAVSLAR